MIVKVDDKEIKFFVDNVTSVSVMDITLEEIKKIDDLLLYENEVVLFRMLVNDIPGREITVYLGNNEPKYLLISDDVSVYLCNDEGKTIDRI